MSEIEQILRHASTRFQTLHMRWRLTIIGRQLEIAESRAIRPENEVFGEFSGNRTGRRCDGEIWWRKPDEWRDEEIWEGRGPIRRIVRGGESDTYLSDTATLHTNRRISGQVRIADWGVFTVVPDQGHRLSDLVSELPLVDPSFLADECDVTIEGSCSAVGRQAWKARAWRRKDAWPYSAFLTAAVDEYELIIDRATGVLLHYAMLIEARPALEITVLRIDVDSTLPDDVFLMPTAG